MPILAAKTERRSNVIFLSKKCIFNVRFFAFSSVVVCSTDKSKTSSESADERRYKRVNASSVVRTRNKTAHRYTRKKLQELVASRLCIHRGDGGGERRRAWCERKKHLRGTNKKFPGAAFFSFFLFPATLLVVGGWTSSNNSAGRTGAWGSTCTGPREARCAWDCAG